MEHEAPENWFTRKSVKTQRLLAGVTQRELSDFIYRSADSVRDYESGKTKIPAICITDIARCIGLSDEITAYLRKLVRARKDQKPIEADMRFNALYLALSERYAGEIFKWSPSIIPGPLQTLAVHNGIARRADIDATDEWMAVGWDFKTERDQTLSGRDDEPLVQFLTSETAFLMLSKEPREIQIEQLDFLTEHDELPGWEIRVLSEPWVNNLSTFSFYGPRDREKFPDAGPPIIYTEVLDSSWLIPESTRIARYDRWRHWKWPRSIRFKEYCDAYWRDHLA